MNELRVAALQMNSTDHPVENLIQCLRLSAEALKDGPLDLICLPENCFSFRIDPAQKNFHLSVEDQLFTELRLFSKKNRVAFHIGATPMSDSMKANRSLWISKEGELTQVYDKIHLFDVDVIGQKPVRESESFSPGNQISIGMFEGWKIGFSVCYDIRFSELYARFAREEVDLILIPSAFLVTTGKSHWEILNRARAIESQAYLISAAQGGTHSSRGVSGSCLIKNSVTVEDHSTGQDNHSGSHQSDPMNLKTLSRTTFGSTIIVDPWGEILAQAPSFADFNEPSWIAATLHKSRLSQVRQQIPMKAHRRDFAFYFETKIKDLGLD